MMCSTSEDRADTLMWLSKSHTLSLFYSVLICTSLFWFTSSFAQSNTEDQEVFDDKRGDFSLNQETLDQAETAFFEGLTAYRAKKYEASAKLFLAAHKLVPYRDLLFNIARSYEELGNKEQAILYYRKYLATKPIDETQVIHRMRELGVSQFEVSKVLKEQPQQTTQKQPHPSSSDIDYLSWSIIGGGVVLLGVGTYFGLSALDRADSARSATLQPVYDRAKKNAETDALITDISLSIGLIGIAGGIYLLLNEASPTHIKSQVSQESTAAVTTSTTLSWNLLYQRELQGFGVSGRF